jgi:LmbE family N-acetylglucosaminyl deacetylase
MSRDVTMLIAHPDDEILFGWPVLDRVSRIICPTSDRYNPTRDWCKERGDCLREVGKLIGAKVEILDNNSEFYRLPTRDGSLKTLANTLLRMLDGTEKLFTHNAWGEYGNIDHMLLHYIGRTFQTQTGCELLVTDIATEINWLPVTEWNMWKIGADDRSPLHQLDRQLFDRIKAIYDAKGCWTWSFPAAETCSVYSL